VLLETDGAERNEGVRRVGRSDTRGPSGGALPGNYRRTGPRSAQSHLHGIEATVRRSQNPLGTVTRYRPPGSSKGNQHHRSPRRLREAVQRRGDSSLQSRNAVRRRDDRRRGHHAAPREEHRRLQSFIRLIRASWSREIPLHFTYVQRDTFRRHGNNTFAGTNAASSGRRIDGGYTKDRPRRVDRRGESDI